MASQIFRAEPADAALLTAIAFAAKQHWGYPAAWMEEWRELLTVSPGFIAAHETFGARWENEVVGFYALVRSDRETFALEHLWLLPKAMGHGIGRALFAHAVARAAALGALRLTIEADEHAEGFYLRMGALRSGVRESQVAGRPRLLPLLRFSFPASRS